MRFQILKSFLSVLLLLSVSVPVLAEEFSTETATEPGPCGPFDPECSKRILRILTGIQTLPIEVDGGVRYGDGSYDGAVRFGTNLINVDVAIGDLTAIPFEVIYLPGGGGFRIRFALAESEALFICKDHEGNTHPPLVGLIHGCRPDGMFGVGGKLLAGQRDSETDRWVMRWAELNFIVNFLRNGNGLDYLHHRLNAFLGASVDTIFSAGDIPGSDYGGNGDFRLRLNMGLTGMFRSESNKWEVRGYAGYRPSVTDFGDWSFEAKTEVLYHLLLGKNILGTVGVEGEYTHSTDPWTSFGPWVSDRDEDSYYVGAMFRVNFGSTVVGGVAPGGAILRGM